MVERSIERQIAILIARLAVRKCPRCANLYRKTTSTKWDLCYPCLAYTAQRDRTNASTDSTSA